MPRHRVSLPLWCGVFLLALVSNSWGQQELRSGKKGTSTPAPVTSTPVSPNQEAVDVNVATLGGVLAAPGGGTVVTQTYEIKRDNITTSSVNLAFGFTSGKVIIELPLTNTAEVCVDWLGGTAVCPAANTAGHGRYTAGSAYVLDGFGITSISVIAASGTQTVYVRAWK